MYVIKTPGTTKHRNHLIFYKQFRHFAEGRRRGLKIPAPSQSIIKSTLVEGLDGITKCKTFEEVVEFQILLQFPHCSDGTLRHTGCAFREQRSIYIKEYYFFTPLPSDYLIPGIHASMPDACGHNQCHLPNGHHSSAGCLQTQRK